MVKNTEKRILIDRIVESGQFDDKMIKKFKNMTVQNLRICLSKSDKNFLLFENTQERIEKKREQVKNDIEKMSEPSMGEERFNDYQSITSEQENTEQEDTNKKQNILPPPETSHTREEIKPYDNNEIMCYKNKIIELQFKQKNNDEKLMFLFNVIVSCFDITDFIED